jgi:hypothetical protein
MIGQICAEVKNYFVQRDVDIHAGNYTIANGVLSPIPFVQVGQYYRIVGSALNDGVYKRGDDDLQLADEEFFGTVWSMRVPKDFLALCSEIEAWQTANAESLSGPYQSESFGGYSYSRGTSANGGAWTWKDQFRNKLNAYRKLSPL